MKKIFVYYLRPFYLRMAWGFVIKFAGTLMDLFLPWALAYMIDTVIPANGRREILLWGIFMLLCSLLAVTFSVVANRMASRVAGDAIYVIRQDLLCPVDSEREMTRRRLTTDGTHTSEEGARRNSSVIADCVNDIYNPSAAQATDILK